MANSQIKLASGVSISLESGANLVLDNSTLSGTGITVPSGAKMCIRDSRKPGKNRNLHLAFCGKRTVRGLCKRRYICQ